MVAACSCGPHPIRTRSCRRSHASSAVSPDQSLERAATLEDVRPQVLSPERLNAFVFSGFAGIALLIAAVGVLAFSVSARTREFGVRLAVGSTPTHLLAQVLFEGAAIAAIGIVTGAAGGYLLARLAGKFVVNVQLPGALNRGVRGCAHRGAAIGVSLMPAARASRVDVLQALRSE
jgi:putative ABC transport system permease protein